MRSYPCSQLGADALSSAGSYGRVWPTPSLVALIKLVLTDGLHGPKVFSAAYVRPLGANSLGPATAAAGRGSDRDARRLAEWRGGKAWRGGGRGGRAVYFIIFVYGSVLEMF